MRKGIVAQRLCRFVGDAANSVRPSNRSSSERRLSFGGLGWGVGQESDKPVRSTVGRRTNNCVAFYLSPFPLASRLRIAFHLELLDNSGHMDMLQSQGHLDTWGSILDVWCLRCMVSSSLSLSASCWLAVRVGVRVSIQGP